MNVVKNIYVIKQYLQCHESMYRQADSRIESAHRLIRCPYPRKHEGTSEPLCQVFRMAARRNSLIPVVSSRDIGYIGKIQAYGFRKRNLSMLTYIRLEQKRSRTT